MQYSEILAQAFRSVKANALRAILTLLIIAFGIMALVGILTSIDALLFTMNDNFSRIGANSFAIRPAYDNVQGTRDGRQVKRAGPVDFRQAMEFKERYDFPSSLVTVFARATSNATLKYKDEKTNPTVGVFGADDQYLTVQAYDLAVGRNFTNIEHESGAQVAIIGTDVINSLFNKKAETAINQSITIDNRRFTVVGVLASKGASMNMGADRVALIPVATQRRLYGHARTNYAINVAVPDAIGIDDAVAHATALMRNIRKLRAVEENDFEVVQSDSLLNILKENTATIRMAAVIIGLITLIGAAIGLMNIMLVSVTERTREIGITKALGATRANILNQFLTEAVLICQLGGVLGILLGIGIGNSVALLLGGKFIIPWAWILLGLLMCMAVGLVSGLYPAMKAARLDPIESLRYE